MGTRDGLCRWPWNDGERRAPDQASLGRVLAGATRIRITDVPELGGRELLDLQDVVDVQTLAELLAIVPSDPFHCMCPGDQSLEIFLGSRRRAVITLHHGRSIRWNGWDSDALLADGEALLSWFADHGVPEPLRAWEDDRRRAERDRLAWEAWQRAAPRALVGLVRLPELANGVNPEYPPEQFLSAHEALRAAYPDEREAIVRLLDWFGSGAGPWSGFPSYETVPEALLLRYPTAAIVEALGEGTLSTTRAEGAARLFASWWFGRMRPGEASALPDDLRRDLLDHVGSSGDPDKLARLTDALGNEER